MSPTSPASLCPRCGSRVKGRCATCNPAWKPSSGKRRRGSTRRSRKLRTQVLTEQPICAGYPPGEPCENLSTEDDHVVPWTQRHAAGMTDEQWDHRSNHQGLCADHHRKKTADEAARHR